MPSKRTKWEYQWRTPMARDLEDLLKTEGELGWELVHIQWEPDGQFWTLIFKRPKH